MVTLLFLDGHNETFNDDVRELLPLTNEFIIIGYDDVDIQSMVHDGAIAGVGYADPRQDAC